MSSARTLAMFPLSVVLHPHTDLPLQVFEPRYLALLEDCLQGTGELGMVLISRGSEVGGGDQRVDLGTVARIVHLEPMPGGRFFVVVRGLRRVRVVQWLDDDPYPQARVEELPADDWAAAVGPGSPGSPASPGSPGSPASPVSPASGAGAGWPGDQLLAEAEAAVRRVRSLMSELGRVPAVAHDADFGQEPDEVAWRLCASAPLNAMDSQELLATDDPVARLQLLVRRCDEVAGDVTALLAGGGGSVDGEGAPS